MCFNFKRTAGEWRVGKEQLFVIRIKPNTQTHLWNSMQTLMVHQTLLLANGFSWSKCLIFLQNKSKILMNICIRLIVIYVKPLKPSGNYSNQRFSIKKLYILHTECIYVFCRDLKKKPEIIILYFISWRIFISENESLLHGTKWNF